MANLADTITNVGANLKEQYVPQVVNNVPTQAILQQYDGDLPERQKASVKIKWADVARLGKTFVYPTKVQSGQGVSYLGYDGSLQTFEDALNIFLVEAHVVGYSMNNRQQVTFEAAFTGDEEGKKAVENLGKLVLDDLKDVIYSRIEMAALFGWSGYGTIGSVSTADAYATLDVVFSAATFSPGWWVGQQGARAEFFNGTTIRGSSLYGTVNTVNVSTRTVNFTISGSGANTVAAGDEVYMKGALISGGTRKEMPGLYLQLTDTSSTIYSVARASYSLMQGQTYAVGSAQLTKAKVIKGCMLAVNKGNMKPMVVLVGTATWADLAAEDMAQRMYDGSYSTRKSESGSEEIVYTNVNGSIRVVCHPYMKAGVALAFSEDDVSWVGATDVTFNLPTGGANMPLWRLVQDTNAYEVQVHAIKSIYHEAPGRGLAFTGIVNST